MNYGRFTPTMYVKRVVFSKAVLWCKRQISLRSDIMSKIKASGVKKIVFIDKTKGEKWSFKVEKVFENMELKRVGQEDQYYFSIDLANKIKIEKVIPRKYTFDEKRQVYVPEPIKPVQVALFN